MAESGGLLDTTFLKVVTNTHWPIKLALFVDTKVKTLVKVSWCSQNTFFSFFFCVPHSVTFLRCTIFADCVVWSFPWKQFLHFEEIVLHYTERSKFHSTYMYMYRCKLHMYMYTCKLHVCMSNFHSPRPIHEKKKLTPQKFAAFCGKWCTCV